MKVEDTLPWYRQFWPWFIISLPAATVVAGFFTLWLALQSDDSLVVSSEDGVDVVTARNAAAELEAVSLGLAAAVEINIDTGAVSLALTSNTDFDRKQVLQLQVIHPTLSIHDTFVELSPAIPGEGNTARWAGHFKTVPDNRRYLVLASGNGWRLSHEWSGQSRFAMTTTATGNGTR
jgi:hypothetical protein